MSVRSNGSVRLSDTELDCLDSNMPKYQPLTAEIQVPKEWPVEAVRSVITDVVRMAINRHLSGQTVIVTIGKVSALVVKNEARTGFVLERTEDTDDDETFKIELLIPVKSQMLSLKPSGRKAEPESVQMLPTNLRFDHPVSRMFVTNSERHKIVTLVPNIEKILALKGITGPEIYDHVLKLTYRVQNVGWLDDSEPKQEPEPSTSARVLVSAEQVTDGEWEVVCFERAMPPRRRWVTCKAAFTWTVLVLSAVFLVLLIYYLVLEIKKH